MSTEEDIIRKANEILQKSTGRHPHVRRPADEKTAQDTHDSLMNREQLSSSYRLGRGPERRPIPTAPLEQKRIDRLLGRLYTARRVLKDAVVAIQQSPVPPPEWAIKVAELLEDAITIARGDEDPL